MSEQFAACAQDVVDALFTEDRAALLAKCGPLPQLAKDLAQCAKKVHDKLERTGDTIRPEEHALLVAACLTLGANQSGIARNPGHAATKFLRYRRFSHVPIGVLVRTDRIVPNDEQAASVLAHSLRVRDAISDSGEPELILNMVVPAIVAALGTDVSIDTARSVLDRGAELAAAYRATQEPSRGGLPVMGNADFLVRIAAYRAAIEEQQGRPVGRVDQAVTELGGILRAAMIRSVRSHNRHGPDEPDVAAALNQYAGYLGGAEPTRKVVIAVHSVLNYRLGLGEWPVEPAIVDPGALAAPESDPTLRCEVEHLIRRLIVELFASAGAEIREPLLQWLSGKHIPDDSENLALLLRRLRLAITRLDQPDDSRPACPTGLTRGQFESLIDQLSATVDPCGLNGDPRHNARYVTLHALPPLWTRRRPAALLVMSHLRMLIGDRSSANVLATLVATHGVRAPVQFVQPSATTPPDPCCPEAGGQPRPSGRPREPVPEGQVCPHRPWGEVGWVENRKTLGHAAGCSAGAARQHLKRYTGPWPELLAN